jgi:hypothetical protein
VSKPGLESFELEGLCTDGLGRLGRGESCAMTEIGQIRREKDSLHTVRMRTRGVGRRATLRFQPEP